MSRLWRFGAAIGLALIAMLALLGLYDRFGYSSGGLFCSQHASSANVSFAAPRVCFGSGVDLRSTSLAHLGDEHMVLVKSGGAIFTWCAWIDDKRYSIQLSGEENLARAHSCRPHHVNIVPR